MHPSRLCHCCPIGACIFPDLRHGFVHRPPDFPLVKVWSRDYGLGERERGNSAIARRGIVSYGGSEPPPPPVAKWFSKELNAIYQVTRFSPASGDLFRLPLVNLARSFCGGRVVDVGRFRSRSRSSTMPGALSILFLFLKLKREISDNLSRKQDRTIVRKFSSEWFVADVKFLFKIRRQSSSIYFELWSITICNFEYFSNCFLYRIICNCFIRWISQI